MTKALMIGVPLNVLDNVAIGAQSSDVIALLGRTQAVTWQVIFDVEPSAVDVSLLFSNDGTNFKQVDNTILTTGYLATLDPTSAVFAKVTVNSATGGSHITVILKSEAVLM